MKTTEFYVKAKAEWKDSSRRKGGYFSYSDVKIENCIIKVIGGEAIITNENDQRTLKRISGKYFSFTGKKVTEKTYLKYSREIALKETARREALKQLWKEESDARVRAEEIKREAVKKEVSMIKIDEQWKSDKEEAMKLSGSVKADAFLAALKALLARNNIEKLQYFYQVMRCL